MQTLSYGYLKPQTGDTGAAWFPALEDNIQQLNDHNHNGINSAVLGTAAIASTTQSVLAASWVATSGGTYRQLVSMPTGLNYDQCFINFKLSATGHQVFPTVEKVSSSSFYVYTNDSSLAYTAVYVS